MQARTRLGRERGFCEIDSAKQSLGHVAQDVFHVFVSDQGANAHVANDGGHGAGRKFVRRKMAATAISVKALFTFEAHGAGVEHLRMKYIGGGGPRVMSGRTCSGCGTDENGCVVVASDDGDCAETAFWRSCATTQTAEQMRTATQTARIRRRRITECLRGRAARQACKSRRTSRRCRCLAERIDGRNC